MLMYEPRGHYDQYGALIVNIDDQTDADIGVLFLHNEGYSTMCGHAVIALGRYIVDNKLQKKIKTPSRMLMKLRRTFFVLVVSL